MNGFLAFLVWFGSRADGAAPFVDTPAHHWVYEGIAKARRDGMIVSPSEGLAHARPKSRDQMALTVLEATRGYLDAAAALRRERSVVAALPPSDLRTIAYVTDFESVLSWRQHLPFLRRAQAEFLPQALRLRARTPERVVFVTEVERTARGLLPLGLAFRGERPRLFRDVPKDHWAAEAIRDLRGWGLIDGYPDERFGIGE